MRKRSILSIIITALVILYALAVIISKAGLSIVTVLLVVFLYALLIPVLSNLPYSFTYYICLPIPYAGAWIAIVFFVSKHAIRDPLKALLPVIVPLGLLAIFHLLTRDRSSIGLLPVSFASRVSVGGMAIVLLALATLFTSPTGVQLGFLEELFVFWTLIVGYVGFSIPGVNLTYRRMKLSAILHTRNIEAKVADYEQNLWRKYSDKLGDVDLLMYYLKSVIAHFLNGDFEGSFADGYKIIREKTVVDPTLHVSVNRGENELTFSEIRTILMHSRSKSLKEKYVSVDLIKRTKTKLFDYDLELLDRIFEFLENIIE